MANDSIWYTSCPLPNALAVAVHTGQLAHTLTPLGINLHSLRQAASPEERLSHFRHTVPGQIRHGGHIPPLWSRSEGRDVRLLGLSWTRESQLVLVRPDSELKTIADLKGKRLALPVRASLPIDFWQAATLKGWTSLLSLAGLSLNDVELVTIPVSGSAPAQRRSIRQEQPGRQEQPSGEWFSQGIAEWTLSAQRNEAFALLERKVDAIFTPGHYGASLRRFLGARILFDLSTEENRQLWLNNATLLALTIDGSFLDEQPEAVTSTLVSVLEAARWAQTHRLDTARIVAAETGNAEELVEEIFGEDFVDDLFPTHSDQALEALAEQNRFLFENGFISRIVPAEEWVERGPLEEAAAELRARSARVVA